jgi:hypothetical protein
MKTQKWLNSSLSPQGVPETFHQFYRIMLIAINSDFPGSGELIPFIPRVMQ